MCECVSVCMYVNMYAYMYVCMCVNVRGGMGTCELEGLERQFVEVMHMHTYNTCIRTRIHTQTSATSLLVCIHT